MSERVHWIGKHGPCCVGPTFAEGDRRDLAEEIMRLRDLVEMYRAATLGNESDHSDDDPGDCRGRVA